MGSVALTEIVWAVIGIIALAWELVGVAAAYGKLNAPVQPLTNVLRDRLMAHNNAIRIGVFLFYAWLGFHFFISP